MENTLCKTYNEENWDGCEELLDQFDTKHTCDLTTTNKNWGHASLIS